MARPTLHPAMVPRCRRKVRPIGETIHGSAEAGPGRSVSNPRPRSRRVESVNAAATVARKTAALSASTDHRSSAKGREAWAQPRGESQETPLPVTSPTPRIANASPNPALAHPRALRAWTKNWAEIAAIPAQTSPAAPMEAAMASVPLMA